MEAYLTISGYVGGDVEFRRTERTNTPRATFRLACTPRVRRLGAWTDDPTTWLTVTCWRALAEHVAESFSRGDAVTVVGRLRTQVWTDAEGEQQTRMVVDATTAGHDLTRGVATFRRVSRNEPQETDDREVGEMITKVETELDEVREAEAVG